MIPFVGVPATIGQAMAAYRDVFCRTAGFEHVSRDVRGLLLSQNKTLPAIADQQVYAEGKSVSRRAMHAAVFEAGWDSEQWMQRHREVVGQRHQGRGREVISLDWTLSHHEAGDKVYGVKRSDDYVNHSMSRFQTVITAVVANPQQMDGLAVEVQAERGYLKMEAAMQRLVELLHYHIHQRQYRKRTEIIVDVVRQLEAEGHFAKADYAFDNGVLTLALTQLIEASGKHWVSAIECSRLVMWNDHWTRVETVAAQLRAEHPENFRHLQVRCRNGEVKECWAFTKTVWLKRYHRKRRVIVHERQDLTDPPRFLLTDALHWESARVIQTWSYRWACEVFHEFCKQVAGFEAAQVRNEAAVKRHFRLSCLAQSLLAQATCGAQKSERFALAGEQQTVGQRLYTLTREAYENLLHRVQGLFAQGQSCEQVLEVIMPA
jgi:hypothetical protein